MSKNTDDFKKYINRPTKKDPRLDPATNHKKAFDEIRAKGPKIKNEIKQEIKF